MLALDVLSMPSLHRHALPVFRATDGANVDPFVSWAVLIGLPEERLLFEEVDARVPPRHAQKAFLRAISRLLLAQSARLKAGGCSGDFIQHA